MTVDHQAFFDELKQGTLRSVYLFYGPEAFIRKSALEALKKKALESAPGFESLNLTVLQSPSAQQIIECCETLPMMCAHRLVIVEGCALLTAGKAKDEAQDSAALCDYLPRVPETTCLTFHAEEALDKRKKLPAALLKLPGAVSFDALDDTKLFKWMNQKMAHMGKRMGENACATLAFVSGRNLMTLSGELQKLAAYVGDREQIEAQDVEQIATHTAECTVFSMVDALCEGRAEDAFRLLSVLLQSGEQRIGILAMITRQYRQLMYLSEMRDRHATQAQIAKTLAVPPFAVTRLLRQAGKRTFDDLSARLELCVQTDFEIKNGTVREEAALERLMFQLLA